MIALIVLLAYIILVRPRLLRWGATIEEIEQPFPCAGIVAEGTRSATMATNIQAPPSAVWPWLAQMGLHRGGWYSYDRLDNWGQKSADRIHSEWQDIKEGQHLDAMPDRSIWWEVAKLVPGKFLALRMSIDGKGKPFDPRGTRPKNFSDSTWSFLLKDGPHGTSRLVVSGYWASKPLWWKAIVEHVFLEPAHWIMQMRQFANLKKRAASVKGFPFVKGVQL